MDSAFAWKAFYAAELDRLGEGFIDAQLDAAEAEVRATTALAWIVPHTRAEVTGGQLANTATAVVASGAERVLALGVLHGGRRSDADAVAAARGGDAAAIEELRGVHTDNDLAAEEFSLDTFGVFLDHAAARSGRSIEVIRRYPFLVGTEPASLPGLGALQEFLEGGAALVVTTDPMHHGLGYGTHRASCLQPDDERTKRFAQTAIQAQLDALSGHRFYEFAALTKHHQSDFRDTGPVTAALLGTGWQSTIEETALVDYTAALHAAAPTWVAGARITIDEPQHE